MPRAGTRRTLAAAFTVAFAALWAPNPCRAEATQPVPATPAAAAPVRGATVAARNIEPVSAAALPSAVPLPAEAVSLALGEIRMLPISGRVRRIAVGNGNHVSATAVDRSLMLIGEQIGSTMLMVWTDKGIVHSYKVRVMSGDFATTRQVVENILRGQSGVTVEQIDSKLVISGMAHRATLDQLAVAVKDVPGVVLNVRADEGAPLVRSVLFRLHFVEVNKSLLEKIGIQWSRDANGPTFAAQGIAANDGIYRSVPQPRTGDALLQPVPPFAALNGRQSGVFLGLATSIASRINLSVTDGDARILASPELTAKSGGKAKLQVGGEIPIPMAGAFGAQTVEFKPYGIIFSVEPVIDSGDIITAKLSTELSQIDPSVTVGGIPGFLTRATSTEISVKPGEMIALSGLVNSELSNAIDKVPGLGSIPILGRLFRSDDFRNKKTDLVVLLEPEIIQPGDGLAAQLRQRGADNKAEFERRIESAPAPNQPPPARPAAPVPQDNDG